MMTLTIPGQQRWNEKTEEFVYTPAVVLKLEHSLLSLAHWLSLIHISEPTRRS